MWLIWRSHTQTNFPPPISPLTQRIYPPPPTPPPRPQPQTDTDTDSETKPIPHNCSKDTQHKPFTKNLFVTALYLWHWTADLVLLSLSDFDDAIFYLYSVIWFCFLVCYCSFIGMVILTVGGELLVLILIVSIGLVDIIIFIIDIQLWISLSCIIIGYILIIDFN